MNSRNNSSGSSNGQSRGSEGTPKPSIPDEKGEPDCPVCLSRVENRAYTNTCLHEFCFPCIEEWSRSHNRCPVCREVYQKILHNIRSKLDYDEQEVEVPPDPSNGILITFGNVGILFTPDTTGLYIIDRRPTPRGTNYVIEFVGPHNRIIIPNITPNLVIVRPENLEETLSEMGAHPHHPHHGRHPNWLRHNHHNRRQQ